jgi:prepilin-type N-terminal cleavage/methylation domain-containing protein
MLWFRKPRRLMKKGFSFIELIVSVSVVGILVGIVLVVMNPNQLRAKARDARRINDLKLIQSGLEQFLSNNGAYPTCSGGNVWGIAQACLTRVGNDLTTYIGSFPKDPLFQLDGTGNSPCVAGQANRYNYVSNGSTYVLTSILESSPQNIKSCNSLSNWSSLGCSGGSLPATCVGVENPL